VRSKQHWYGAIFLLGLAATQCTKPKPSSARARELPAREPAEKVAPKLEPRPVPGARLVLAIVLDQLPSWAIERYLELLPENGVLRRGIESGAYFPKSRYGYATTLTAPGHATIYTGAAPSRHGVVSNEVWSPEAQRALSAVDDRRHRVFGLDGAFASPSVLRSETVADVLERATDGRAHTVSLSLKDRGAVLPAGKKPDLVLWFDAARPGFTTSEYYAPNVPAWIGAWERDHPIDAWLGPWVARDPARLERLLGADAASGEGNWQNMTSVFPHDPKRSKQPYSAFRATPGSSRYLMELARACVEKLELGRDDIPDLLMISVSGTDYVGHVFGVESWEYIDNLARVDEALGELVRELEKASSVRVLITSDHGVAPLPERSRARGARPQRVNPTALKERIERSLRGRKLFGARDAIAAFTPPLVHLTKDARESPERDAIARAVIEELESWPAIYAAFDVLALARAPVEDGRDAKRTLIARAAAASIPEGAAGDVYVVLAENNVIDPNMPGDAGTNHGSPWQYDTDVPVLFFGPGITKHTETEPVEQSRVAATLARLLEIPAPADANSTLLRGAPALRSPGAQGRLDGARAPSTASTGR
jgi:arylsulfatase A-like enzyme